MQKEQQPKKEWVTPSFSKMRAGSAEDEDIYGSGNANCPDPSKGVPCRS